MNGVVASVPLLEAQVHLPERSFHSHFYIDAKMRAIRMVREEFK